MYRASTKRVAKSGKIIGGHVKHFDGWDKGEGKHFKKMLSRLWRYYWRLYAKRYEDADYEPDVRMRGIVGARSVVEWKNN